MPELHLYGAIEKFDAVDNSLIVTGIASTEDVDSAGETVTAGAMRKALPSYLQSGTVREMHQPIAAGRPMSAFVDDDGRTHLTVKIVDPVTIEKIKQGVLKGFSIGGKALAKVGKSITELLLKDVSVVDVPCNSQCVFNVIKFDAPGDKCSDASCNNHHEAAVKKCGSCMSKSMTEQAIQKLDSLAATVATLAQTVETLSKAQPVPIIVDGKPVDIAKVLSDVGELQKRATETTQQVQANERKTIIAKMDTEGRVAFKSDGVAYTVDDLGKMDLGILKVLSVNAQALPLQAKAIYSGEQKPNAIDPKLKGSDRVEKAWESDYGSLDAMRQRFN